MNRTPIEWCRTYNETGTFYEEGFSVNPVRFKYTADLHGPYENKRFMHFDGRVIGPHDPNPDGLDMRDWAQIARAGKKAAGALLDGKEYREFPEVTRG